MLKKERERERNNILNDYHMNMRVCHLSLARPQPEKECMVVPEMRVAAAPVEAVMARDGPPSRSFSALMISLNKVDLPVPAFLYTHGLIPATNFNMDHVKRERKKHSYLQRKGLRRGGRILIMITIHFQ